MPVISLTMVVQAILAEHLLFPRKAASSTGHLLGKTMAKFGELHSGPDQRGNSGGIHHQDIHFNQ